MEPCSLDAAGHRRSPVTMSDYHRGRVPRNKGRRYPAEPLAKFLAHPDSIQLTRVTRPNSFKMPNLGLASSEITSLVAYLETLK